MLTINKGRGSDMRRKGYMRDHLSGSNIFSRLLRIVGTDCRSLFTKTYKELRQVIDQEMENLCGNLHIIVAEEGEVTEATRFPDIANTLHDDVEKAEKTLEKACKIVDRLGSTSSYPGLEHAGG